MPPSYSPCPRPILKRPNTEPALRPVASPHDEPTQLLAIDPSVLQPLVHFPPNPALSRTFSAYSSASYDRSPIVVSPNRCALPERGCPGRTYNLGDADRDAAHAATTSTSPTLRSRQRSPTGMGRHLHPRVGLNSEKYHEEEDEDEDPTPKATPLAHQRPLPPLIPDLSSESDDSDGFMSPPNDLTAPAAYSRTGLSIPQSKTMQPDLGFSSLHISPSQASALSFLPHPHAISPTMRRSATSPTRTSTAHPPEEERPRHRHSSSTSSHHTRRRHASNSGSGSPGGSPEHGRYKAFSDKSSLNGSSLAVLDQGCFGGF
ncbi:hypothetical protein B0H21DRAFT_794827 [Amylocystis lapponica]|nr:hypothetical protein B0H21DRAFT_794827 [Amylocystis lapponica]